MASRVKLNKIKVKAEQSRSPLYKDYDPVNGHDSDSLFPSTYDDTDSDCDPQLRTPLFNMRNIAATVSITTKIKKIHQGTSDEQLKKKKRLKHNKSLCDWWSWYWQAPKAHFPFLYFLVIFICCAPLSLYWFMDNNAAFIICGIIGLSMFGYALHKFRLSINLKKEIDKFTRLNHKLNKENREIKAATIRLLNANNLLQQTRVRLTRANHRNCKNLKRFQKVEHNLNLIGKKTHSKLSEVHQMTRDIRKLWRDDCINVGRTMLHVIFDRFNRNRISTPVLTHEEFDQFNEMLPKRYADRLKRVATFNTFSGGKNKIDLNDFVSTLDTFAMMETDDKDMEFFVTPSSGSTPDIAAFTFVARDIYSGSDDNERSNSLSILITPPVKGRGDELKVRYRK